MENIEIAEKKEEIIKAELKPNEAGIQKVTLIGDSPKKATITN